MAYAAVVSLNQILKDLKTSDEFSTHYPKSKVESFHDEIGSLQYFLEDEFPAQIKSQTRKNLERELRDAIWRAEDIIEFFISSSSSSTDASQTSVFSTDLQNITQEIESITEKMEKFAEDFKQGKVVDLKDSDSSPRESGPPGFQNKKIFGLDRELDQLKNRLTSEITEFEVVPIVGMAGIGKTTLAKIIYDDPLIVNRFRTRVWIKLSDDYSVRDILLDILGQIVDADKFGDEMSDNKLLECVFSSLQGKRYLVVLDDVCDTEILNAFPMLFPYNSNGSRIILTTRLLNVAVNDGRYNPHRIEFLDEKESWNLLRETVFGEEMTCSSALEREGKKIARNCQGLPLAIITVGSHLAKKPKTVEFWKTIAESGNSVLANTEEVAKMSKNLSSDYKKLPQHLKTCFLYMGVFPQNYEIRASRLVNLWIAEGILDPGMFRTPEEVARECLQELINRSLVLVRNQSSVNDGGAKTCIVHYAMLHVCSSMAKKHGFCTIVDKYDSNLSENLNVKQRRMSVHRNVVLGIKDVYDTMGSIPTMRSFLCTSHQHHSYPLRAYLGFRLLRVLDALTIRFHEFPKIIFSLIQLRYLALTCNRREVLNGLSKLSRLQFLIVRRDVFVNSSIADQWMLPTDIWYLRELRQLQCMGCSLPDPCGVVLPNLLSLLDLSPHSCTKEVLEKIPNLRKLGIRVELITHENEGIAASRPFDHLLQLQKLESLKCVVVNPYYGMSQIAAFPDGPGDFPTSLKKLTLRGCGFPWEEMKKIARLPNLQVLKLQCRAFRGANWVVKDKDFPELRYLLLEDMDLVNWRGENDFVFSRLKHLSIRNCYKLEMIPLARYIPLLQVMELVDCNPVVMALGRKIREWTMSLGSESSEAQVHVIFSWEKKKIIAPSPSYLS